MGGPCVQALEGFVCGNGTCKGLCDFQVVFDSHSGYSCGMMVPAGAGEGV